MATNAATPSSSVTSKASRDGSHKKLKSDATIRSTVSTTNNKENSLVPTKNSTPKKSIADSLFVGSGPKLMPLEETRSTASISQTEIKEEDNSIPGTVVACDETQNVKYESNASELSSQKGEKSLEKTVVNVVIAEYFFPEVKFADKDFALAWDDDKESFCQFFITKCNVPNDVDKKVWWKTTKKWITSTMSQTRNDRNTAVKNTFLGNY